MAARDIYFKGSYDSFTQASAHATGYDTNLIVDKVACALSKVRSGQAAYERDSVLFEKMEFSFPLLAGLFRAASEYGNRLDVLDFGGSLGSSYFQCQGFLSTIKDVHWNVVEQKKFVSRGRQMFESDTLKFFSSIEEAALHRVPNVILFASVLQYIENSFEILQSAIDSGARYIIIDRTPFSLRDKEVICVQHVPATIYTASYPCKIMSVSNLERLLAPQFDLVSDFDALGGYGKVVNRFSTFPFQYKGMIWRRRQDD